MGLDVVEICKGVYQLITPPWVCRSRPREFACDIQSSRGKFEKSSAAGLVCIAAVVVDISTELPGQHVEVKIIEVKEAVIAGISFLLNASLGLNCRDTEIAQFNFNSQRDESSLKIRANSVQFGIGDS